MSSSHAEIDQPMPLLEALDRIDLVAVILRAMCGGETPIIAVNSAKSARVRLLNRLVPALRRENFRVIHAVSVDGKRISLVSLMDQVVGDNSVDLIERSERCHAALTSPEAAETRIALIIDDAHLLTDKTLRYLDLVTSTGRFSRVPLQVVLVGGPEVWDRLPPSGGFAGDKVALSVALPDEFGVADSEDCLDGCPVSTAVSVSPIAAEAHGAEAPGTVGVLAEDVPLAVGSAVANAELAVAEAAPVHDAMALGRDASTADDDGAEPREADETPVVKSRLDNPAPASVTRALRRGRFVLAASVAAIIIGGAVAGGSRLIDGPFYPRTLTPPVGTHAIGQWFDRVRLNVRTIATDTAASFRPKGSEPIPARLADPEPLRNAVVETAAPVAAERTSTAVREERPKAEASPGAQPVTIRPDAGKAEGQAAAADPATAVTNVGEDRAWQQPAAPSSTGAAPAASAETTKVGAISASSAAGASANVPPVTLTKAADQPGHEPSGLVDARVSGPDTVPHETAATTIEQAPSPAVLPDARARIASASSPAQPGSALAQETTSVVAPLPAATAETGSEPLSPNVVAILVARGDGLLATGDVTAARLMYQRAASSSAQASVTLGMTYDPRFLPQIGARGIVAEPERAIVWYKHAADLGDPAGARLLIQLQGNEVR
jgi:hypothetical protein